MIPLKVCNDNEKRLKQQAFYTTLSEGSEHRRPSVKEEKEDCFVVRDIEFLFKKGINNII